MARSDDVSRPFELGQHAHPDGGHAGGDRDLLLHDEVGERLGRQVGAGHHEAGARGDRGVGEAPGVGVEHRHDRQDAVGLLHAEAARHHRAERVQVRGAVGVDDALGVARGAARVAHRRGPVLVLDVEVDGVGGGQQVLVVVDRPARRRGSAPRPCRRPSPRCGGRSRAGRRAATAARASDRSTKITSSSAWLTM